MMGVEKGCSHRFYRFNAPSAVKEHSRFTTAAWRLRADSTTLSSANDA
jgi:hypothetical protein